MLSRRFQYEGLYFRTPALPLGARGQRVMSTLAATKTNIIVIIFTCVVCRFLFHHIMARIAIRAIVPFGLK